MGWVTIYVLTTLVTTLALVNEKKSYSTSLLQKTVTDYMYMYRFSGLIFFFYRLLIFGLNCTDYWFFAKFYWLAISGHTFYWLAIFGSKFYRLAVFGCYWLAISEISHWEPHSYGHVMSGQSVHLTTILFLGKLEQVLRAHTFACII